MAKNEQQEYKTRMDEDAALQTIGALIEFLKVENDHENVYRGLVASGTLVRLFPELSQLRDCVQCWCSGGSGDPGSCASAAQCANEAGKRREGAAGGWGDYPVVPVKQYLGFTIVLSY
ncbi:hypothetical protein BC938DRAFT_473524 [Jimgerdemannia flammicorona]|uniref:PUL domain-containing protein n=1 Tax=Jimgerdemannia flammicorona TaxID=994334 RepID=A0A433Q403_9FUNG|nr:hypothetical protein BC938DRAFT_473524 [Jimgerdemannia flammicorona]